jgi:glycosyltransferase involved in cell wall biosynthesis
MVRPRIFGVLMTRNESKLLAANVKRHWQTCCDRILVVDNGSSDSTPRVLRRLARRWPVEWTTQVGPLHQPEIVTALADDARRKGADWIVPLDTDEFWHASRPFHEIVSDPGARNVGAFKVPRIEFIQARGQRRSTTRGALRATMRVENPLPGMGPVNEYKAGRRSMCELQQPEKLLVRAVPGLSIHRGAHEADNLAGPVEFSFEMAIFHVPILSREALRLRAEHGRRIAAISDDPDDAYHNRAWARFEEDGLLDEAWRAHSHADGYLEVAGRRVELIEDRRLN